MNHFQVTPDAKLDKARWCASPHFDERSPWCEVELVVVHCVSLPEGEFGTGAPERLFCGELDVTEHVSFADLEGVEVAPHVFIDRRGEVTQLVTFDKRAWHAGDSRWCGRHRCNDFSIGIELEGSVDIAYTQAQYAALSRVLAALVRHYPGLDASSVVGHSEIAPGRKADPGPCFDWARLLLELRQELRQELLTPTPDAVL